MPDPTIYFIRHGQTDWNASGRLQGQRDTPLNDTGRKQAARNGRALAAILCERRGDVANMAFLASPLSRASETMEIIRDALGLPRDGYRTDDRLREISFGEWEGRSWPELLRQEAEAVARHQADQWRFRAPRGESYQMLYDRVIDYFQDIETDSIVVSHGGVSRCLQTHVLDHDRTRIASLKIPQDRIMIVRGGEISWY